MFRPLLVLVLSQALFSCGDLLARNFMPKLGFHVGAFVSAWFLAFMVIRTVATFGQLYVFTHFQLGRAAATFAAANLVLANVLGLIFLGELLPLAAYGGVVLAIVSIYVVVYAKG